MGVLPLHPIGGFRLPALGIHPTIETWAVQLLLIGAAIAAFIVGKKQAAAETAKAREAAADRSAATGA